MSSTPTKPANPKTAAKAAAKNDAARAPGDKPKPRVQQRLTYVIGGLDRLLRRHMTDALAPLGITLAQYTALSVLEARGASSNAQLAERSWITPQSANEVMSVMAARGFVTREADPSHGRIILLKLTDAGAAMLRECEAVLRPLEMRMLGDISADDAAHVQRALELFSRNLRG
ncbi:MULTISPECIES: MarR family winged helix-turn-helix transcriptional regulator [Burkholderia]|uniref:MarR family winged helix-turn-helix transcriptional regulator n=1 Tax=Burkholderia anthinoferrum TaxID=3090833 RepID=A0ABU5WPK0_9BURK|nr:MULTISPECIES: MarR family winged helix-turn-helix transcriptional regulator [Burkholderia]MEB2505510.1 MarR family winged helix-turn-helix transcriptional regulator [Burkholderia anthinoferrum]MEB2531310.1 MarR family winged helix-turn-helix transcriptional regulator [Burkholderia anthinoferrum]MEB2560758.1 MarR family winged helix-turn-helix transcriptional regulator [Burkholderia anthinoferrum]MEB2580278.1 MarR family winged helix-turn-helix transcriptional regulator [Burkholderia anthinof